MTSSYDKSSMHKEKYCYSIGEQGQAAAAKTGDNNTPKNGYNAPAAIGTPSALYTKLRAKVFRKNITVVLSLISSDLY